MDRQHRQLPLMVQLRDDATLENFLPGPSAGPLIEVLAGQGSAEGEAVVFIHGAPGCGKSHLLQACCHLVEEKALYLPLADLLRYPPEDVLAGVEALALVALDDLDAVLGQEAWESALFGFYNRALESGCRLLIAATGAPRNLNMHLADLRSRLSWGVVYHLPSSTDMEKRAILQFRAERRGLQLSDDVANYIVNRSHRDLPQLLDVLERLDSASLAQQRALSIPFVKQTLNW